MKDGKQMTTRLAAALLTAVVAVLLVSSPAGAWSAAEEGALSIHATRGYAGSVPAVQVDSAGNIYACGYFRGSGDIDPNPEVTNTLSVTGQNSSVVSKYSPSGNLLWYVLIDADGDDQILDCSLNDAGNYLAVAGKFKGTISFPTKSNIASAGD